MSYEMPELEGGDTFVPLEEGDVIVSDGMETNIADADPAAVETQPNLPVEVEVEKRKKRVSLTWKRPKSHLYEYNYDYGSNYYKGMIDYLDERSGGYKPAPPKALSWAERALKTYSEKREAAARNKDKDPDVELLHKIRNSVNTYTVHARTYARKINSNINSHSELHDHRHSTTTDSSVLDVTPSPYRCGLDVYF